MIFAARGIMVSLAFFAVAYSFLSVLALLVWQGTTFLFRSRPVSVGLLFGLRILPFVLSAAVTMFLVFPSFLLLESHSMDEVPRTFALSVCTLFYLGVGLYRVTRCEAKTRGVISVCLEGASSLENEAAISTVVSPQNVLPLMLVGIRAPKVLISKAACEVLSEEELRAAVRHEIGHLRSRDNLKDAMLNCIPFPGMAQLEKAWREAAELAADQSAVASREEALNLAAALLKLARRFPLASVPAFTTGLASTAGSVSKRVECLLAWKAATTEAKRPWRYTFPLLFGAILCLAAKLGPVLILTHTLTEQLVP